MLGRTVREAARRFGGRTAYVEAFDPRRRVTYAELDRLSDEVATGLAGEGLSAGHVLVLVLPPSIDYVVAYLAAAKLGAVTAGINPRLMSTEREDLVRLVSPTVVLADPTLGDAPSGALPVDTYGAVLHPLRTRGNRPPVALDDEASRPLAICFTSGTTGRPKAVTFGVRQLAAITAMDVGHAWGGGGVSLAGTSFAHLGPMTKLPGALRRGGTTWILRRWRADEALELTSRIGATSIGGIPTQLALMLREPAVDELDLSAVRLIVLGGGPATPTLIRAARDGFGAPVCVRYSCTEAGIGLGTAPEDPPEAAELTVGRPHSWVELGIRDHGRDVARGEMGEVVLRSPAVMSGYWGNPEATREAFTADGFVRTGDLGALDDRGRLRLVGRISDRYVRGGYNVEPTQVEAVLARHPAVAQVAVVGVPDEVWGESGLAVVVPEPGASCSPTELREFASARLARHKCPAYVELVGRLPLTAGDKVDKRELVRRFVPSVRSSSHA